MRRRDLIAPSRMDFEFTAEEEAYRLQVRTWLADHVPDWARDRSPTDEG
ncbi:MAG: hypothetical protein JRG82_18445, partial [Deltaproteobacteria bacterium]|nr:hypothetical protein [Deltaproteobacteria bacterium]